MNDKQYKSIWYKRWSIILLFILLPPFVLGTLIFILSIIAKIQGSAENKQTDIKIKSQIEVVEVNEKIQSEARKKIIFNPEYNNPVVGKDNAKVTIVEFGDFTCGYCAISFPAIRELVSKYSDNIKWIYRPIPLQISGSDAFNASMSALCANNQNKFLAMHDTLFMNNNNFKQSDINKYALQIGLDIKQFNVCFEKEMFSGVIKKNLQDAIDLNVTGTPTWFINGMEYKGSMTIKELESAIQQYL